MMNKDYGHIHLLRILTLVPNDRNGIVNHLSQGRRI